MARGARTNAPRIPPSTWEQHRCRIKGLFVDQKRTLSKVVEIMKQYGLHASESQYERQLKIWGVRKNRTRDEWCLIKRVVDERRLEGRDSAVLIDGVVQPSDRLEREFARSNYRTHGGLGLNLPGHIKVMSPLAAASTPDNSPGYSNSQDGGFRATQTVSSHCKPDALLEMGCLALMTRLALEAETPRNRVSTIVHKCGLKVDLVKQNWESWLEFYKRKLGLMVDSVKQNRIYDRKLGLKMGDILQSWKSWLRISNSLNCDEPPSEDPDIVMSNYEPGCGGSSPVTTPSSPSGSWSLPSLESVGITSEEWVTRGWDVFFGAWG